ncbi:Galactose mutarotase [Micractinium conductrix]|uniref:Galactose mutarotase n=1 Tax=Micractinium conductrix TaxID=554055 RepID=A0A2P6VL88_9CHLO|nr:Galactose mutarotase [Micractinium conductrix]|eukprot:PSC74817.1 Galactose mutarotase [Micractinium conductrix]
MPDGTSPYFGALVGRVANRIAGAQFSLDGKTYKLAANNGPNCLHGGKVGFDKVLWEAQRANSSGGQAVRLTYTSKDGEESFPGTASVCVTYTLTDANELLTEMRGTTDAATPINLAQHSYFNLGGHASGTVLDHELTIHGDHYTPVDDVAIPTGDITPVSGTPFDFTSPHRVGERIQDVPGPAPFGYDHNYVLFGLGPDAKSKCGPSGMASDMPQLAATLYHPPSGRGMNVSTTAPGMQFYSGNFLDGTLSGKGGAVYKQHAGLCLETQGFPNAINQDSFPNVVLRPGEEYRHLVVYHLDVPRASCRVPGCGGTWAPSPCAAGCFPATPRVCLDVSLCGPGLPARWFDWQLLHMSDGLVFEGRRPAAVNSIAAVVHRLHEANGCSEPMGCEHFKRQLHEAVMEFGYLMCALLYLVHLGVQYDVTAVGSTMCRHNSVAHLMDIATGERYIYASVLLYVLMVTCHIPVLFVCT